MLEMGFHVDVYLVTHYDMNPERLQLIRDSLPENVKLSYWDDATRELAANPRQTGFHCFMCASLIALTNLGHIPTKLLQS